VASASPAWLQRAQNLAVAPVVSEPVVETVREVRPSNVPAAERVDVTSAESALDAWAHVLEAMDAGPVPVLKHAVPLTVSANSVRIAFEAGSFYARKVVAPEVKQAIGDAVERALGAKPEIEIVLGALPEDAPTVARREEARRAEARARREAAAKDHPVVRSFLAVLGGEIRGVKLGDD
jgi:hypothetical protein